MSIRYLVRLIALTFLSVVMTACTLSRLEDDLEAGATETYEIDGTVVLFKDTNQPVMVVATRNADGSDIYGWRVLTGSGEFNFVSPNEPLYFFAFIDANSDFVLQEDELFGFSEAALPSELTGQTIRIAIPDKQTMPAPEALIEYPLLTRLGANGNLSFQVGTVTTLDNPVFSLEQAKKGLWEPYSFLFDGVGGVYFLQPYDKGKTPVLFVHGIDGSPAQFRNIVDRLDREKYQAWVYYYPSGLSLVTISQGLREFIEILGRLYDVDDLHVVAHSMGGLAAKGAINYCVKDVDCAYIKSLQTISTPWAGVASAASGVKWSPTVVPVWRDIEPDSLFIQTLFEAPFPKDTAFNLIFGFKQDSFLAGSSGDGVIKLNSQLRPEAQEQAASIRGFDEGHVSILSNEEVIAWLLNNIE